MSKLRFVKFELNVVFSSEFELSELSDEIISQDLKELNERSGNNAHPIIGSYLHFGKESAKNVGNYNHLFFK